MPKGPGERIPMDKYAAIVAALRNTRLSYRQICKMVGGVSANTVWRIHQQMEDDDRSPAAKAFAI